LVDDGLFGVAFFDPLAAEVVVDVEEVFLCSEAVALELQVGDAADVYGCLVDAFEDYCVACWGQSVPVFFPAEFEVEDDSSQVVVAVYVEES